MDCYVGAVTGAFKAINFSANTFDNVTEVSTLVPVKDEITAMCWGDDEQTEILAAQLDRHLKFFDTTTGSCSKLLRVADGEGRICGLQVNGKKHIATATESGLVKLWDSVEGTSQLEINAGDKLLKMKCSPHKRNVLATGGRENPLKLWDIERPENPIFTAKNVRPDWLQLRVPIWMTDVCFLSDTETVVTCTGKHQIRMYDPRTGQRRPIKEMEWEKEPLTAIATGPQTHEVVAGNSKGEMALFDLRNKARMVHKLKGAAGAIKDIAVHGSLPLVASCGIDRFLRLHNLNTKQLVKKIYCKAKLNCLLLRKDLPFSKDDEEKNSDDKRKKRREVKEQEIDSDSDNDVVWAEMAIVDDSTTNDRIKNRKKRKVAREEADARVLAESEEPKKLKLKSCLKRHTVDCEQTEKKKRKVKKLKRSLPLMDSGNDQIKRVKAEID